MTIDELRHLLRESQDGVPLPTGAEAPLLAALDVIVALRDVKPGTVHRALVAFDAALSKL